MPVCLLSPSVANTKISLNINLYVVMISVKVKGFGGSDLL